MTKPVTIVGPPSADTIHIDHLCSDPACSECQPATEVDRNDPARFRQSVADWQDLRLAHERPPRPRATQIILRIAALASAVVALIGLSMLLFPYAGF